MVHASQIRLSCHTEASLLWEMLELRVSLWDSSPHVEQVPYFLVLPVPVAQMETQRLACLLSSPAASQGAVFVEGVDRKEHFIHTENWQLLYPNKGLGREQN